MVLSSVNNTVLMLCLFFCHLLLLSHLKKYLVKTRRDRLGQYVSALPELISMGLRAALPIASSHCLQSSAPHRGRDSTWIMIGSVTAVTQQSLLLSTQTVVLWLFQKSSREEAKENSLTNYEKIKGKPSDTIIKHIVILYFLSRKTTDFKEILRNRIKGVSDVFCVF